MPPAASGREVTTKQIDVIRRWIDEGAKWQTHWAFVPPNRPELPPVKNISTAPQSRSTTLYRLASNGKVSTRLARQIAGRCFAA